MLEFVVRAVFWFAVVGLTAAVDREQLGTIGQVAALGGAFAVLVALLDRRSLRNPGVSGWVAVIDAAFLAFLAARFGYLTQFGFLVLAPCAYAAARHGSNPAAMAPIASAWILVAANLTTASTPSGPLLGQALAVLVVGLLLTQARIVMTVTRPAAPEPTPQALSDGPEPIAYLELRENFRSLRDRYRELERKSRRERIATQLAEAAQGAGDSFEQRLAHRIREIVGSAGITLHTCAQFADAVVIRAASGDVPEPLKTVMFPIAKGLSEWQMRNRIEQAMMVAQEEDRRTLGATVLLKDRGLIVGALCLTDESRHRLDEAVARAEEAAPFVAALIQRELTDAQERRRLREIELLYAIATTSHGAESSANLAARVARDLDSLLNPAHLAIWFLDGDSAYSVAALGASYRLFESLDFDGLKGIPGWLASGAEEVHLFDTADDPRIDRIEALKRRVGSYALVPIDTGGSTIFGFLTIGANAAGAIDVKELESVRIVVAELAQALSRLEGAGQGPSGFATPREFQEAVARADRGSLITLEPLRLEQLIEQFGRPAVDMAFRKFVAKLRLTLPAGALLCRPSDGDWIVFLRDVDEPFARRWAAEATATASLAPLRTPDGSRRIPLGVRTKIAEIAPQNDLNRPSTALAQ